jgi:hypothetical protein
VLIVHAESGRGLDSSATVSDDRQETGQEAVQASA